MKIDAVEINNFRNLSRVLMHPAPGVNLLVGKNAQGKTNFLEALYVLANGASFRPARDRDLVQVGQASYLLRGRYRVVEKDFNLTVEFSCKRGKIIRVNDKRSVFHRQNRLQVLLFTPDDLYLVKGSPERRRSFLDLILSQVSAEYEHHLNRFTGTLSRRNNLLKKQQVKGKDFQLLTDMLVQSAVPLVSARINLVNRMETEVASLYHRLTGEQSEIKIRYALSFSPKAGMASAPTIYDSLRQALEAAREQELNRRTTLLGPHRDDFNIYLQGSNAKTYGSQGQQRSLAVALKLATMSLFKSLKGYFPVFLLDEVLAELDEQRRRLLLDHLCGAGFQAFLSTVDSSVLTGDRHKIFFISGGSITEEG